MARRSRYIRASLLGSIGWRASSGRGRRRLALAPEQLALRLAVLAHSEADGVVRWHSVAVHRLHHHVDHRPAPLVVVLHDLPFLESVATAGGSTLPAARSLAAASALSEAAAAPPIFWLLDPAPLARGLLPPRRLACIRSRAAAAASTSFFFLPAAFPAFILDLAASSAGVAAFRVRGWTSWCFPIHQLEIRVTNWT